MERVSAYYEKIRGYTSWRHSGSPWAGGSLERLVAFLSSSADKSSPTSQGAAKGFAWLYRLDRATVGPGRELSGPEELNGLDEGVSPGTPRGSNLIVLRGYPSAQWMLHIGAKYQVDPGFWLRHADFLSDAPNHASESGELPSSCSSNIQLSLYTLGSHRIPHEERDQDVIDRARRESRESMVEYRHKLNTGILWSPCASIVRNHWVLGERDFCIEQKVSVALIPHKDESDSWTIIMWFDIGDDLSRSPPGPWFGDTSSPIRDIHRYFLPLRHTHLNFILDPERYLGGSSHTNELDKRVNSRHLKQSLGSLPTCYGRSLDELDWPPSPFSVLSELLSFVVASQLQFIKQLELRITNCVSEPDGIDGGRDAVSQQTNLVYYRRLLQDQVRKSCRVNDFIKHRKLLGWSGGDTSCPPGEEEADTAALRLQLDIRHVTDLAIELRDRCDREMTVLINAANIAEVQRGIRHGRALYKLTLLAAIYVPASFVTSFFGMNIYELGAQDGPKFWIWAVVTVVLFTASFAFVFLTRQIVRRFRKQLARLVTI